MRNLLILGGTAFAVYYLLNRQVMAGSISETGGRVVQTTTGKVIELSTDKDGFIFDQYGRAWT